MPLCRPDIDIGAVRSAAIAAFESRQPPRWGLEVETLVGHRSDPSRRPTVAQLPPCHDLPAGGRVSIEPGGQVEISTAPHDDVDAALDSLRADEDSLVARLHAAGLRAIPGALDVYRRPERILDAPRYRAMEAFFDARGPDGRLMMCNTAALQINVGHDPRDPAARWRLVHALAPILLATFANSPGRDADGTTWASLRQRAWGHIDPGRTGVPDLAADPVEAWTRYVLDADVMMLWPDPETADAVPPGLAFGDWLRDGHATGWPSREDLAYHLTTLFPPVRPRGWLELRVIDAVPETVREVVVLVLAAALCPPQADVLVEALPDTAGWWETAARDGLAHDGLAGAADLLFEMVAPALPRVTRRPARIQRVRDYHDTHVRPRLQPWAMTGPAAQPVAG